MSILWCPKDKKHITIDECCRCPFHVGSCMYNSIDGEIVCGFVWRKIKVGVVNHARV